MGKFKHIFEPNFFRDIQKILQDKASMDMTVNEFKYINQYLLGKKYQSFTIDMSKHKYQGQYRLGMNSKFVPNSSPF